jgi:hypothetical protein
LSAIVVWVGCDNATNKAGSKPTAGEAAHQQGDGHAPGEKSHAESGHSEEGPHHGHLIELGQDEYHAELTHDDATSMVSVYLLDSSAQGAVPIAETEIVLNLVVNGVPQQAKLAAAPQKGDPAGQSSRFSAIDEKLLAALEAPKTTGRLNVTIEGKAYTGQVEHHEHDEHKH